MTESRKREKGTAADAEGAEDRILNREQGRKNEE
jgi:hypothetical protein